MNFYYFNIKSRVDGPCQVWHPVCKELLTRIHQHDIFTRFAYTKDRKPSTTDPRHKFRHTCRRRVMTAVQWHHVQPARRVFYRYGPSRPQPAVGGPLRVNRWYHETVQPVPGTPRRYYFVVTRMKKKERGR